MSRAEGSGYRDLTIYDAPSVALSQMAGGQFSLENLIDSVRDPKRLAPEARKTLAERMLGTNEGLLGTAANIATNPFVIAMLFCTLRRRQLRQRQISFALRTNHADKPLMSPRVSRARKLGSIFTATISMISSRVRSFPKLRTRRSAALRKQYARARSPAFSCSTAQNRPHALCSLTRRTARTLS